MNRTRLCPWTALLLAGCWLLSGAAGAAEKKTAGKDVAESKSEEKKKEDESIPPAPPRAEGEGPFERLILRGATLIDGTGAPPIGPVDIVIEKNRIVQVKSVGNPGIEPDPEERPKAEEGDREIDLSGMYVTAGVRGHARPHRRHGAGHAGRVRLQAVAGARHHHRPRSRQRQRPRVDGRPQGEERQERDHGAAHRGLRRLRPGEGGALHQAGRGAQVGRRDGRQRGRRRQVLRLSAGHHAGRHRRDEEEGAAQRLPSRADERGAHQRPDLGPLGPHHHGALVRAAGGPLRRPHGPGLPARLQLRRRVAPLRPGRPAVEAGRAAGTRRNGTR